ncbi:MAG: hypothetical protein SGCHY_000540 [Lobulomycetales sp.]
MSRFKNAFSRGSSNRYDRSVVANGSDKALGLAVFSWAMNAISYNAHLRIYLGGAWAGVLKLAVDPVVADHDCCSTGYESLGHSLAESTGVSGAAAAGSRGAVEIDRGKGIGIDESMGNGGGNSGGRGIDESKGNYLEKSGGKGIDESRVDVTEKSGVKGIDESKVDVMEKGSGKGIDESKGNDMEKSGGKVIEKNCGNAIAESRKSAVEETSENGIEKNCGNAIAESRLKSVEKNRGKSMARSRGKALENTIGKTRKAIAKSTKRAARRTAASADHNSGINIASIDLSRSIKAAMAKISKSLAAGRARKPRPGPRKDGLVWATTRNHNVKPYMSPAVADDALRDSGVPVTWVDGRVASSVSSLDTTADASGSSLDGLADDSSVEWESSSVRPTSRKPSTVQHKIPSHAIVTHHVNLTPKPEETMSQGGPGGKGARTAYGVDDSESFVSVEYPAPKTGHPPLESGGVPLE